MFSISHRGTLKFRFAKENFGNDSPSIVIIRFLNNNAIAHHHLLPNFFQASAAGAEEDGGRGGRGERGGVEGRGAKDFHLIAHISAFYDTGKHPPLRPGPRASPHLGEEGARDNSNPGGCTYFHWRT